MFRLQTSRPPRRIDFLAQVREKALEKNDCLINGITITVYLANDTAGFAIFDALQQLRPTKLWRDKVRRCATRANAIFEKYQKMLKHSFMFDDREKMYLDLADDFHDVYDRHVTMLRLAVSQVLTRMQLPHREVLSYVIAAEYTLWIAAGIWQSGFTMLQRKTGMDFPRVARDYNLKPVLSQWDDVLQQLVKPDVMQALEDDKDVNLANEILCKRLADHKGIDDIATKSLERNKEALKKYNPEGYEWFVNEKLKEKKEDRA